MHGCFWKVTITFPFITRTWMSVSSPLRAPRLVPAVFLWEKCKSVKEPREDRRSGPHSPAAAGCRATTWLIELPPSSSWHCVQHCSNVTTFYSTLFLKEMKWNILLSTDLNYHLISNTTGDERGNLVILWYPLIFSLIPHIVLLEVASSGFEHFSNQQPKNKLNNL